MNLVLLGVEVFVWLYSMSGWWGDGGYFVGLFGVLLVLEGIFVL